MVALMHNLDPLWNPSSWLRSIHRPVIFLARGIDLVIPGDLRRYARALQVVPTGRSSVVVSFAQEEVHRRSYAGIEHQSYSYCLLSKRLLCSAIEASA